MPCPNGILIKEETKFDYNHSLVHLRVTKQITNQQVAINSLKSNKKVSNDYYYVTWFETYFKFYLKLKLKLQIHPHLAWTNCFNNLKISHDGSRVIIIINERFFVLS